MAAHEDVTAGTLDSGAPRSDSRGSEGQEGVKCVSQRDEVKKVGLKEGREAGGRK